MALMTQFLVKRQTLVIDLGKSQRVLSSAPRGGGLVRARYILNHQVAINPRGHERRRTDPARYLGHLAESLGIRGPCVGLMTAISLNDIVTRREEDAGLWVEGFLTVGVSNAVRAGEPVEEQSRQPAAGTINIILRTNARLPASAMVGMVQVATESKTAALMDESVRARTGRGTATGTGTDATVVVGGDGIPLRYSGTHTKLGELVGRLIYAGVVEGLRRYRRWHRTSTAERFTVDQKATGR